ncbi:MAG TPA: transporter substrate-binding domain-containing protein [Magnetospirillaceae bacterium]|nr:transporter substrate-binding domain-containing protein [Magnetospirillaceae bacterium]
MRAISFLALSACAWLSAGACPARDLRGAFGQEKAPYLWVENDQVKGLEYDIVRAALAAAGDGLVPTTLPNRRVTIALSGDEFDMVTGMQVNQAGDAFYSDEYLAYANYAITRKAKHIKLSGLSDLFGHSVSIWQNAWEDLNLGKLRPAGPNGLDYTEFTSQYRQTKFFWVGRCDVTVIDRNIFLWYSRQFADEIDTTVELDFQNILPQVRVRAAFRDIRDRDAFNAGLKTIRANGGYERIFAQYGLTNPG